MSDERIRIATWPARCIQEGTRLDWHHEREVVIRVEPGPGNSVRIHTRYPTGAGGWLRGGPYDRHRNELVGVVIEDEVAL